MVCMTSTWTFAALVLGVAASDNWDCIYNWNPKNPSEKWSSGALCGTSPGTTPSEGGGSGRRRRRAPVENNLSPRAGGTIPEFELNTAFRVVDSQADTEWIAEVTEQSESLGDKFSSYILEGIAEVPAPEMLEIPLQLISKLGLEVLGSSEDQPLTVDLTDMMNALKKNILDVVDQEMFESTITSLQTLYADVFAPDVKEFSQYTNSYDAYSNLVALELQMDTAKANFYQNDYHTKYAFFVVEPLVTHASLHYTVTMLRAAASMSRANSTNDPSILDDMCIHLASRLSSMWSSSGDGYMKIFDDSLTSALEHRKGNVSLHYGCVDECYMTYSSRVFNEKATYSWVDNWKMLGMTQHTEGWSWVEETDPPYVEKLIVSGTNTDGSALQSEIDAYVSRMTDSLDTWSERLTTNMQTHYDGLNSMVASCNSRQQSQTARATTFV